MSENGVTNVRYVASTSYQNPFVPHSTTNSKVLWTHPCLQLVLISRAKSGQSDLRSVGHLTFQPPMAGDLYCPSPRRLVNRAIEDSEESDTAQNLQVHLEDRRYSQLWTSRSNLDARGPRTRSDWPFPISRRRYVRSKA